MSEIWEQWQATRKEVYRAKEGVYSRYTSIDIGQARCEVCEQITTIMSVDIGDGEYGSFDCCKSCLDKLWEKA